MHWLASLCALFIALSVSGCAIIEAEKNNRGGFLDEIADEHWMKADSKKMRALRAITLEASLARIAMIAPKSASDRSLLARRIGETTKRADIVRRCAFNELQLAGQLPSEPCFFFDSVMVDYENALFDLALVALPIEEARSLISRVTGGIASVSVNPLQLVQALLDIGREAFRYGRVVGAIYRDTLELEVQVWLSSGDDRVAGLSAIYARGNDDIPAWRAAIAALRAQGLEPVPQQRFIAQLYSIIGYICGQIVPQTDPSFRDCAQPDLTQRLPVVNVPGGRSFTLSGIGGATGAGSGRAAQSAKQQAGQGGTRPALEEDKSFESFLDPYKPRDHSRTYVESLQDALCLPRGHKEFGKPGPVTKALVEIYEETARSKNANGKLDENEAAEVKELGECDTTHQSYLERKTYFADARGARAVALLVDSLQQTKVGANLPTNATLPQLRTTIRELRNDPDFRAKIKRLPDELLGVVTRDLLRALPRPRISASSTSSPTTNATPSPPNGAPAGGQGSPKQ